MTRTPHWFECTDAEAQMVARLLALNEELHALALTAPDGTVFDACENAVIDQGRELQTRLLTAAVASRVEAAEKKGPRSAAALAVGPRRTAGRRSGNSSAPSA
jgi:hypothetical protein